MTEATKSEIAEVLNRYPEVVWDRWVEMDGQWEGYGAAFGWIARDDGYFDFIEMSWWPDGDNLGFGMSTSSARYSLEFHERLNNGTPHYDCKRVEDDFGQLVERVVHL